MYEHEHPVDTSGEEEKTRTRSKFDPVQNLADPMAINNSSSEPEVKFYIPSGEECATAIDLSCDDRIADPESVQLQETPDCDDDNLKLSPNENDPTGEESVTLLIGQNVGGATERHVTDDGETGKSKWIKLRSTIKVARAFSPQSRKKATLERQDSFLKRFSTRQGGGNQYEEESTTGDRSTKEPSTPGEQKKKKQNFVVNPDDTFMFVWMTCLTIAVLYNLWTCIAREAFTEIREGYESLWLTTDAVSDLIYLLDILVQFRTGFLEHGLIVFDSKTLTKHYIYSKEFAFDLISLLPLDFIQLQIGVHPLIRFPEVPQGVPTGPVCLHGRNENGLP